MNQRVNKVRKEVPQGLTEEEEAIEKARYCVHCKEERVSFRLEANRKTLIRWCINLDCALRVDESNIKTWQRT